MIDEKLLSRIKKMANSPDWKVREYAASEIKRINDEHFLEYMPVWKRWVKNPNPNIRRAVEVGLLRINKKFVPEALDLLEILIYDNDPYVRKNCGPFVLSHICRKDPNLAFERLKEWIKIDNEIVRWNITKCLGAWFGKTYPRRASRILEILEKKETRKRKEKIKKIEVNKQIKKAKKKKY